MHYAKAFQKPGYRLFPNSKRALTNQIECIVFDQIPIFKEQNNSRQKKANQQ
jgi:hypothetical protein